MDTYGYFHYMWHWYVKPMEEAMGFEQDGNFSKTLQFLLFCNGSAPLYHDQDVEDTSSLDQVEGTTEAYTAPVTQEAIMTQENLPENFSDSDVISLPDKQTENGTEGGATDPDSGFTSYEFSTGFNFTESMTDSSTMNDDDEPRTFPWTTITETAQCESAFTKFKDFLAKSEDRLQYTTDSDLNLFITVIGYKNFETYKENVEKIFTNSSVNLTAIENHVQCLYYENFTAERENLMLKVFSLRADISHTATYADAYKYAKQLVPLYRERQKYDADSFTDMYMKIRYEVCEWIDKDGEATDHEWQLTKREFEKARDQKDLAARKYETLQKQFMSMYTGVVEQLEPVVHLSQLYLENSITKMELAQAFENPMFTQTIDSLRDINVNLMEAVKDYREEMIRGRDKLETGFDAAVNLKLPVLNIYTLQQLDFIQQAKAINDSQIQGLVRAVEEDKKENMVPILTENYKRLIEPIENLTTALVRPLDTILADVTLLRESLREYLASAKMNTNFYM